MPATHRGTPRSSVGHRQRRGRQVGNGLVGSDRAHRGTASLGSWSPPGGVRRSAEEQATWTAFGVDGSIPFNGTGVSLINDGGSKLDPFLSRRRRRHLSSGRSRRRHRHVRRSMLRTALLRKVFPDTRSDRGDRSACPRQARTTDGSRSTSLRLRPRPGSSGRLAWGQAALTASCS